MVEYQSGTVKRLKEGEVVEDVQSTSFDVPPIDKSDGDVPPSNLEIPMPMVTDGKVIQPPKSSPPPAYVFSEPVVSSESVSTTPEVVTDITPDLDTENWMSQLRDDEIFNSDKGPAPRLHGLRRLAKPYILREESKVNALIVVPKEYVRALQTTNGVDDIMSKTEVVGTYNFPMASVTFNITLRDGRMFSDSADAFFSNCEALALFPTAVASARAEARCLRKVLGIREHAAEEITDKDPGEELAPDDDSPIKPVQSKLIDKILQSLDMSLGELLEKITTREIFSVEELTTGEASKALRLLNDYKKKKKKQKGSKKS